MDILPTVVVGYGEGACTDQAIPKMIARVTAFHFTDTPAINTVGESRSS